MLRGAAPLSLLLAVGCEDYEQRAMRIGEAGRPSVMQACSQHVSAGTAAFRACAEKVCRGPCGELASSPKFFDRCLQTCTAAGPCATDDDCADGLRCTAIAPRVRTCTAASASPATSAAP